jgi:hypothetical protein
MIKSKLMGLGTAGGLASVEAGTVTSGLTAAGTNQATALLMDMNDSQQVTTTGSSTGVIFSATGYSGGDSVVVVNHGANTLSVYPATGGKIGNAAANAAFTIVTLKSVQFWSINGLDWAASSATGA